eukprot:05122_5
MCFTVKCFLHVGKAVASSRVLVMTHERVPSPLVLFLQSFCLAISARRYVCAESACVRGSSSFADFRKSGHHYTRALAIGTEASLFVEKSDVARSRQRLKSTSVISTSLTSRGTERSTSVNFAQHITKWYHIL